MSDLNDPMSAEQKADLKKRQDGAMSEVADAYDAGTLSRDARFSSADAAAQEALGVLDPISKKYSVELGGFVSKGSDGYSYGQIVPGTDGGISLGAGRAGSFAGFHTHPSGSPLFSPSDIRWVNKQQKTNYLMGPSGVVACDVGSSFCSSTAAARFYYTRGFKWTPMSIPRTAII